MMLPKQWRIAQPIKCQAHWKAFNLKDCKWFWIKSKPKNQTVRSWWARLRVKWLVDLAPRQTMILLPQVARHRINSACCRSSGGLRNQSNARSNGSNGQHVFWVQGRPPHSERLRPRQPGRLQRGRWKVRRRVSRGECVRILQKWNCVWLSSSQSYSSSWLQYRLPLQLGMLTWLVNEPQHSLNPETIKHNYRCAVCPEDGIYDVRFYVWYFHLFMVLVFGTVDSSEFSEFRAVVQLCLSRRVWWIPFV